MPNKHKEFMYDANARFSIYEPDELISNLLCIEFNLSTLFCLEYYCFIYTDKILYTDAIFYKGFLFGHCISSLSHLLSIVGIMGKYDIAYILSN